MGGNTAREDTLGTAIDRMEDIREALQAQNRALATMLRNQQLHGELLRKILEEITKPSDGDGLAKLLEALVEADEKHAATLQRVLAAIERQPSRAGGV